MPPKKTAEQHAVLSTSVPKEVALEVRKRARAQGLSVDSWLRARILNTLARTKPVVVRQDDANDETVRDEDVAAMQAAMTFRVLPDGHRP